MGAYGTGGAGSADLRFAYEACLAAARDLWVLADDLETANATLVSAHLTAAEDFLGPMRRVFNDRFHADRRTSSEVAGGLRDLATQLGADWAAARSQQNRINHARYVQAMQERHRNMLQQLKDSVTEFFVGEPSYDPPPAELAPATGPGFSTTGGRLYPAYGP